MSKRSGHNKNKSGGKDAKTSSHSCGLPEFMDDLRQQAYPPAWRIGRRPVGLVLPPKPTAKPTEEPPKGRKPVREDRHLEVPHDALAELATCLWYLKTKHFKREWPNDDTADDDPRTRRTLGRLNKGADALKKCGVEIEDPTGKRYPAGGEAMMRPLDFVPTQGLTFEKVTEAVMPMVYWNGRLIQRAEVFVAVPKPDSPKPTEGVNERAQQEPRTTIDTTSNPAPAETGEQT